jgi:hypothetical protein
MDDETNPNHPAPELEHAASDAPMHFMFELQLMTYEIVGKPIEENRINVYWKVKRQHVREYLTGYYENHGVFPMGCHDLGHTKSRKLKVGVVDFDAIRQKIRVDTEKWKCMNFESPETIEAFPDYPLHREIELGMREQAMGRDANEAVYNLRQKLTRRLKKI